MSHLIYLKGIPREELVAKHWRRHGGWWQWRLLSEQGEIKRIGTILLDVGKAGVVEVNPEGLRAPLHREAEEVYFRPCSLAGNAVPWPLSEDLVSFDHYRLFSLVV